jgi:hypothetical protein
VRDALHLLRESLSPGTFDPLNAHNAFVLTMADATAAVAAPEVSYWERLGQARAARHLHNRYL